MLPKVAVGRHCCAPSSNVENYRALVGDGLVEEIQQLSRDLKEVRACQVNATASGGGVAELLERQFPLYHALGMQVDWRVIHGDKDFFTVTKGFHNALLTDEPGSGRHCAGGHHPRRVARGSANLSGPAASAGPNGGDLVPIR